MSSLQGVSVLSSLYSEDCLFFSSHTFSPKSSVKTQRTLESKMKRYRKIWSLVWSFSIVNIVTYQYINVLINIFKKIAQSCYGTFSSKIMIKLHLLTFLLWKTNLRPHQHVTSAVNSCDQRQDQHTVEWNSKNRKLMIVMK